MSFSEVSKQCAYEVSALVLEALENSHSISELAYRIGVDERTIRRWRDGIGDPRLSHYRMLRRVVEEGGDDSPSVFLKTLSGVFFFRTKTPRHILKNVLL